MAIQRQRQHTLLAQRRRAGIGQDHDRRLQALGAVHRQQPHCIQRRFGIALHLQILGVHPAQKGLQAGSARRFTGQRLIEHGINRIAGFFTQPCQQPRPSRQWPRQHAFEIVIGRHRAAQPQRRRQPGVGAHSIGISAGLHRRPQAAAAPCRQACKIIMVQPDQRRYQQRRQREIIARLADKFHQRDEIGHCQRLGQIEAIGAGHGHALFVQRAHQRVHQPAAPPHQDHDILRRGTAATAGQHQRCRPAQPIRDGDGNTPRQINLAGQPGLTGRLLVTIHIIAIIISFVSLLGRSGQQRRPQRDTTGLGLESRVRRHILSGKCIVADVGNHAVHTVQDDIGGTEIS